MTPHIQAEPVSQDTLVTIGYVTFGFLVEAATQKVIQHIACIDTDQWNDQKVYAHQIMPIRMCKLTHTIMPWPWMVQAIMPSSTGYNIGKNTYKVLRYLIDKKRNAFKPYHYKQITLGIVGGTLLNYSMQTLQKNLVCKILSSIIKNTFYNYVFPKPHAPVLQQLHDAPDNWLTREISKTKRNMTKKAELQTKHEMVSRGIASITRHITTSIHV